MFKQIIPVAAMATILLASASCNKGGFKKTKDGVEYNIVKDSAGTQTAKIGDILTCHYMIVIGDSVMFDSHDAKGQFGGQPIEMPFQENPSANKKMDPTDVLKMLTAGDSVIIRTEIDSAARKQLPFAKPTDKIEFRFTLFSIKSKNQFEADQKAKAANQAQADDKTITEYLSKNNITTAQKTASGIYYTISKTGSGENASAGKTVKVNYTGKLLDGTVFDSNMDKKFEHVEPFEFPLGQGRVIPGWDEGIALLNKGAKATLYIPSVMAYGANGAGSMIPPNSILIFDVELIDFK